MALSHQGNPAWKRAVVTTLPFPLQLQHPPPTAPCLGDISGRSFLSSKAPLLLLLCWVTDSKATQCHY